MQVLPESRTFCPRVPSSPGTHSGMAELTSSQPQRTATQRSAPPRCCRCSVARMPWSIAFPQFPSGTYIILLTSALCKPIGLLDTVIQHRPALHLLTLPANKM